MINFDFRISTHLHYGAGVSEKLGEEIKKLGYARVAAVVDQGVFNHPQILKALDSVKQAGIELEIFKNTAMEPTYSYLENFRKNFTGKTYDGLIGIGGGSALDLTKGLAVLLTNEGEALSFRGFPQLKQKPLPVLAVPTTAGTGSEVTFNAVFTEEKEKKKLGINSWANFPVGAFIDPLITVNCPKNVTVSAGADALVHTLESYVHKNHTPVSRMYSLRAFQLLYNNLIKVLKEPADVEIRGNIALGAYLAGVALINSGSGPSGAFSYPLGAVYKVPHGYAGAMFLPSITNINIRKGYQDYAALYDLIEGVDASISLKEKNIKFGDKIQLLMDTLEVPQKLSHYKLGPADVDFMIGQHDVLKAAIAQNPIEITKEETAVLMKNLA